MRQKTIYTERLALHHIDAPELIALYEAKDDRSTLMALDIQNPHRVLVDSPGPLHWRVPQLKKDPALNQWFVRWIVLRENRHIIGSISFHGPPDSQGMMEIGLGIEAAYRNQGLAKEALLGMWRWALTFPQIRRLRYTVSPSNLASMAVIQYFGFPRVGRQSDDVDGEEEIFEIDREGFNALWGDAQGSRVEFESR